MRLTALEKRLDEVAHLHEAGLVESRQLAHGELLGPAAGGEDDAGLTLSRGHIDALDDARPEGGGRVRSDDAGGAENRYAAEDAEAGIERLLRHLLAAGNGNGHDQAIVREQLAADGAHVVADVALRHRVDRRAANGKAEPLASDGANARTAQEFDLAGTPRQEPDVGRHVRAVRGVRIVAAVLDDHRMRAALGAVSVDAAVDHGEADLTPVRQKTDDVLRHLAGEQPQRRRARRCRRTGAGGETRTVAARAPGVGLADLALRVPQLAHAARWLSAKESSA